MDTRLHACLCMHACVQITQTAPFPSPQLTLILQSYNLFTLCFELLILHHIHFSIYVSETNKPSSVKEKMITSKLLLLLLLLVSATVALGVTDPELKQCKHQCKVQQQFDEEEKRACSRKCEEYHQEKQQRQQEGGGPAHTGDPAASEAQKQFRKCLEQCQRESEQPHQQQMCQMKCEEKLREQGRGEESKHVGSPYVFEEQHFTARIQTQHGRVRVLPKFTERSKLLKGIENYRLSILEADPQTFILPNHWDAEAVFFVVQGKGSISLVRQAKRESINIRRGDIVRVPAGTTTYMINRHNNKKLILVKLLQPISTPGEFESFFGAGGKNPESFFRGFSDEILEAAFNTRRDKLHRIFGEQNQGVIVKASEEQIKALCQHEEGGIWPFGGGAKGKFNIFEEGPKESNQYGQFYAAGLADYKQLEDLDIAITFANISKGGMSAPLYNSRVTKISLVTNGEGYFEMACPHLPSQGSQGGQQQQGGGHGCSPRYQKVSARLRRGVAVIIPPAHPFVAVASKNQNLEVVCFEINASRNEKFPLAGKRNVIKQLEEAAKELAFGVPATEVDEVFNSQQEEFFFKGPLQREQDGRADV